MAKTGKSKRPHKHCQKYLNERKRIKNKTEQLEKKIEKLEENKEKEVINPNTKLPAKKGNVENFIKSCRIGRTKEDFQEEKFKRKPSKHPKIEVKEKKE